METLTPPPTPPRFDQLCLSPSPPTSPTLSQQIHTILNSKRARSDSEETLLNGRAKGGVGEEDGENNNDNNEEQVYLSVTLGVKVCGGDTSKEIREKVERVLVERFGGKDLIEVSDENKGKKQGYKGEQGGLEGEEVDRIHRLEEELKLVRRQLKRSQQSVQDLRFNNSLLRTQANEAIQVSLQAERNLDKVLATLKLKSGARQGGSRGSSWAVVFALFVWIFLTKCC